ncbi:type VII secretion protein EccB [Streptomyces capparidis]
MASRKDLLNAYTFARRRTVAAFLQPTPSGSEEGAPRALRAVLPSIVVGSLILVGFGAWGIIKPTAPKGWSTPGEYIIVGSESTTRYVVLEGEDENGRKLPRQLHPVLNFASAKLLLDEGKGKVIKVKESELDKLPHGATIGIPYAPDRLPKRGDAAEAKKWVVCVRPGAGGGTDRAVFVLGGRDEDAVEGQRRLKGAQALYVQGGDGATYLVDPRGTRFLLGGENWKSQSRTYMELLRRALFGEEARPQRVTDDWLDSLNDGGGIFFPDIPGLGETSEVPGLTEGQNTVGTVLKSSPGGRTQHYVVMRDKVELISDFTANLLLKDERTLDAYGGRTPRAVDVALSAVSPDRTPFPAGVRWPEAIPDPVNTEEAEGRRRTVACSVYRGTVGAKGRPDLSVWAGNDYPTEIVDGAAGAYVTPGKGLLYREITADPKSGPTYLVTDTGLRYSVSANDDSEADRPVTGTRPKEQQAAEREAQVRLGYDKIDSLPVVPQTWSGFLSKGPALNTRSAAQPQGS